MLKALFNIAGTALEFVSHLDVTPFDDKSRCGGGNQMPAFCRRYRPRPRSSDSDRIPGKTNQVFVFCYLDQLVTAAWTRSDIL
jgi:hypothetical protein